jgi:hypothetical protein
MIAAIENALNAASWHNCEFTKEMPMLPDAECQAQASHTRKQGLDDGNGQI